MTTFDKEQMLRVHQAVVGSVAERDPDLLASLYRPTATLLPPDGRVICGTDAIRAEFRAWFDGGLEAQHVEDVQLQNGDSIAVETGLAVATFADGTEARSNYVVVHVREDDGNWLMDRDVWTREGGTDQAGGY